MKNRDTITVRCFDGTERTGFKVEKLPNKAHLLECCYDEDFNSFNLYLIGGKNSKYLIKFSKL